MGRWWKALQVGLAVLLKAEQLWAGGEASFVFSWRGRKWTVNVSSDPLVAALVAARTGTK